MTKTVLFYARYSTDRQNEVSIETQVDLGRSFVERQGWKLAEIYCDAAISGTSFMSRPGIQQLLAHVRREKIDVVLCVTVDRLSRDVEHSSKILKELRYRDVELWSVQAGQQVTDMELSLRAVLSHELVEQIRYRTREGMKTAVSKGKATTCLPMAICFLANATTMAMAIVFHAAENREPVFGRMEKQKRMLETSRISEIQGISGHHFAFPQKSA